MDHLTEQRLQKLERIRAAGIDPYPARVTRTHTAEQSVAALKEQEAAGAEPVEASLTGRLMALRGMGKTSFGDLRDGTGKIQALFRSDVLGEAAYKFLKDLDIGDFIGITGKLLRSRTGEPTVEAKSVTLLCKSLMPLPEKWHGLADVDTRYRQRYLDLIANAEVRQNFQLRSRIISTIRRFMEGRGFMEVETPVLVGVAAGAHAHPFTTHHNALDRDLYLRIATELHLKRLIVGGFDKVFEIGRVFRNEGLSFKHNPEYTLMESYEAYADYNDVMQMVEQLILTLATDVLGGPKITIKGETVDVTPPWPRLSIRQAIRDRGGIDIEDYPDGAALAAKMAEMKLEVHRGESRGRLVDKLLSTFVEPHLIQPTFITEYPVEMSPLAKRKPGDPRYVERFEGFIAGMEVANSYSELNDPVDQRARMEEQERLRREIGEEEEADRLDTDFLTAMEYGMPPTGGLGIGIDRLIMALTGQPTIRDVILFPQLKEKA